MSSPAPFQGLQASTYARPIGPFASSASTASSALTVPTPAPTPAPAAQTKAYYRIIRLDKHEIDRRIGAGHCTYCNDTGHARRSCAAGRLMRKVPKRVLDARLRSGVCPLCGDPSNDGHCKLSCPQKLALQAALDAKRDIGGMEDDNNSAHSALSGTPWYVDRMTRRRVPQALARYNNTNNTNITKSTNSRVAIDSVSISTHSTDEADDLIDLCDTRDASPSSLLSWPFAPSSTSSASMTAFTSFQNQCTRHKRTQNHHNLLDTEATETVWGGMMLPVAKIGLGFGFDDAEPTEDLVAI